MTGDTSDEQSPFTNPETVSPTQARADRTWITGSLARLRHFYQTEQRRPTRREGTHEEARLKAFVATQRKLLSNGSLPQWRQDALEWACPNWNETKPGRSVSFDDRAAYVLAFRSNHGSVPSPFSDDPEEATHGRWYHARVASRYDSVSAPAPASLHALPEWKALRKKKKNRWYADLFSLAERISRLGGSLEGIIDVDMDDYQLWKLEEQSEIVGQLVAIAAEAHAGRLDVMQLRELEIRIPGWKTVDLWANDVLRNVIFLVVGSSDAYAYDDLEEAATTFNRFARESDRELNLWAVRVSIAVAEDPVRWQTYLGSVVHGSDTAPKLALKSRADGSTKTVNTKDLVALRRRFHPDLSDAELDAVFCDVAFPTHNTFWLQRT